MLVEWGGAVHDITHVIAVSSTGTIIPGIEFRIVQDLGLSQSTQRFGINFQGYVIVDLHVNIGYIY